MASLEIDGARLHYEVHGSGPPVVLVHGSGGNHLSWWQQVPTLAARHRVIAYDQCGFGRSTCAPEVRRLERLPRDLAAVLDACAAPRTALVCQSLGGWAGLPFACAHPERVAALVLCGTPGGFLPDAIRRDLAGLPARMAARPGVAAMALSPGAIAREPAKAFLYERIAALNPPDVIAAYGRGIAEPRVDAAALAALRVPTLVLGGDEDAFFSPAGLAAVAAAIPGARHRVLAGVGHSPYWEQPEAFNQILLDFLEEIEPWGSTS